MPAAHSFPCSAAPAVIPVVTVAASRPALVAQASQPVPRTTASLPSTLSRAQLEFSTQSSAPPCRSQTAPCSLPLCSISNLPSPCALPSWEIKAHVVVSFTRIPGRPSSTPSSLPPPRFPDLSPA
ncbi:hypothetical protein M0R45_002172 [Rubus argutus]|uniref:Uncharacterized protein n=1 Tax=Rubus argutus TaxID=59490 RepID=A0AAW1VK04_RUBAR